MTTLYQDIGGEQTLKKAVQAFYTSALDDPRLTGYFDAIDVPRLRRSQVTIFAAALGAPGGRRRQHRGKHPSRGIDHSDFDLVLCHLADALRTAGVPDDLMTDVLLTIAPLARDLVDQISPPRARKTLAQPPH